MKFLDVLVKKDGLIKGPFGGDIKKSLFVEKGKDTYKVYEQGVILNNNFNYGNYYISGEYFKKKLKRFEVLENDLLMTGAGTLGEILTVPKNIEPGIINQALLRIRLNENIIDKFFFKYYFNYYIKKIILKINGDSVIPNLPPLSLIKKTEIKIPSISDQKKIGNLLNLLDKKINDNEKLISKIENKSKLIYNYWFNQFEFSNSKNKPYKSSTGKFVWNEKIKRDIPENWGTKKMHEIIESAKSGDWGKENMDKNFSEKVTCIRGADINALNGKEILKHQIRYIQKKNSYKFLKKNDIIIEISGGSPIQSTGRIAYLTDASLVRFDTPVICSNFCRPITIKDKSLFYYFVYTWKNLYDSEVFFNYEGQTSGIKNLLIDDFMHNFNLIIPDKEILTKFNILIDNLESKKQKLIIEINKLNSFREWLVPLLMSNKIKIN